MAKMSVAEMSIGRNIHGRNVRGRNVLADTSVSEMSVAEMSEHRMIKLLGFRQTAFRLSLERYFSQLKEVSILYYQMKHVLTNFCG